MDLDLTRTFPAEVCRRWCILPFDKLSKSILVATANPFNRQAAKELAGLNAAAHQATKRKTRASLIDAVHGAIQDEFKLAA